MTWPWWVARGEAKQMLGFQEDESRRLWFHIAFFRLNHQKLDIFTIATRKRFRYQSGDVLVLQALHSRPVHLQN